MDDEQIQRMSRYEQRAGARDALALEAEERNREASLRRISLSPPNVRGTHVLHPIQRHDPAPSAFFSLQFQAREREERAKRRRADTPADAGHGSESGMNGGASSGAAT